MDTPVPEDLRAAGHGGAAGMTEHEAVVRDFIESMATFQSLGQGTPRDVTDRLMGHLLELKQGQSTHAFRALNERKGWAFDDVILAMSARIVCLVLAREQNVVTQ